MKYAPALTQMLVRLTHEPDHPAGRSCVTSGSSYGQDDIGLGTVGECDGYRRFQRGIPALAVQPGARGADR